MPEKIQIKLKDYFDQFNMHFTMINYTTDWQQLKGGIVTGCTISVIIFGTATNQLLRSVEIQRSGPTTKSGVRLTPSRVFMDDMTVTARTVIEGRWMLEDQYSVLTWARMWFKQAK